MPLDVGWIYQCVTSNGPSLPACDVCLREIFENLCFLFTVKLIVLLDLFIHPNQGTSFIIYLLKFHLLPLNYTCLCLKDLEKIARKSKIARWQGWACRYLEVSG